MRLKYVYVNTDANGFSATNGTFSGNGWFSIVKGFTTAKKKQLHKLYVATEKYYLIYEKQTKS